MSEQLSPIRELLPVVDVQPIPDMELWTLGGYVRGIGLSPVPGYPRSKLGYPTQEDALAFFDKCVALGLDCVAGSPRRTTLEELMIAAMERGKTHVVICTGTGRVIDAYPVSCGGSNG